MRGGGFKLLAFEQNGEFLTAEATDNPAPTRCFMADTAKNLIADAVSKTVVDLFEVIDIEHDRCELRRPPPQLLGLLEESPAIEDAGQRIGAGEPDQLALQAQQAFRRPQARVQFL